ncbi:MAG TPA: Spy/CpxP family protein refolding chaperone [Burkholderiales bacterium]
MALGLAAGAVAVAQPGGPGYGPGMMGGYGPGMGPGMMGGYGPGQGMMGGGYGPGWGASGGATAALNLTDEQREKIFAIQEQNRQKNWDKMGQMRAEQFKLRSLYNADSIDPQAFAEQQKKVDDLRREMLVSRLETRKQVEAVLTPEQRQQFRQYGPRWLGEPDVE